MVTTKPPHVELWSALPTPFLSGGLLDEVGLRHNVERCIAAGLDGVYCNGLMGEVWSLTLAERLTAVEVIVDAAAGRLGVSPVTSTDDLADTIALTRHAKETGAAYAVLVPPSAGPRSTLEFFRSVLAAVDMPYVIFNPGSPDGQGCALSTDDFAALCGYPNVRILKTTANKRINTAMRRVADGSHVRVSDPLEEHFFDNITEHGQQLLYCDPEGYLYQTDAWHPVRDYVDLIQHDDLDAARRVFDSLAPLRQVYRKWIIGPLEIGIMPNAALKLWCELIGMAGGPVRAPLAELSPADREQLTGELREALSVVHASSVL